MQHAAWTYIRLYITTIAIIVMARMTNNINPPRVPPTMAPTDSALSLLCWTACGMCTCMLHEYEYMNCSRYREIKSCYIQSSKSGLCQHHSVILCYTCTCTFWLTGWHSHSYSCSWSNFWVWCKDSVMFGSVCFGVCIWRQWGHLWHWVR